MSLKEIPAPHYQGKVGLKGKLLFGKCKSRHKPKDNSPEDNRLNCPNSGSSKLMPNHSYSVQEGAPEEPSGSTPNPLRSCEESTRAECSSGPWCHSLKPDRVSDSKKGKAQDCSSLKGWRKLFCRVFLCARRLKFKPALSSEDLNHGFTYFNQQTRDSVDVAIRPSVIFQVIEQEVTAAEMDCRHCTKTEQSFLKGIFCLRKKKLSSSKPHLKGLDPTLVIQEATPCPCLQLKKQLRHQMRGRSKKPSPFFQERIGSSLEYIHEETIVLSNRHTDEGADGGYQSPPDDSSLPETLEVCVDVTPVMPECESRTCPLHAVHAESFGETSLHGVGEDGEYAVFPEEEILTVETIGTDGTNASPDIAICQKHEEENEAEEGENLTAVNAPENLLICEPSATSPAKQEDSAIGQKCESTVTEVGQATSHLSPTTNLNCESMDLSCKYESGLSPPQDLTETVDELLSCPDVCHGKHRLDVSQRKETEPADDARQCEIRDPKPPEVLLYQTARILVQAAMEAASRQLEEDLRNTMAGRYEETGEY